MSVSGPAPKSNPTSPKLRAFRDAFVSGSLTGRRPERAGLPAPADRHACLSQLRMGRICIIAVFANDLQEHVDRFSGARSGTARRVLRYEGEVRIWTSRQDLT